MRSSTALLLAALVPQMLIGQARPHARDLGVAPGIFAPGLLNAITGTAVTF